MQMQNNYDKDVYNGDIGFIRSIDMIEHTHRSDFDGHVVVYDWSETVSANRKPSRHKYRSTQS
jgi:exodeoxyribonuclease V alpha subunit